MLCLLASNDVHGAPMEAAEAFVGIVVAEAEAFDGSVAEAVAVAATNLDVLPLAACAC